MLTVGTWPLTFSTVEIDCVCRMSITNLLLKPLSCFVLYRLYQDRSGFVNFPSLHVSGQSHASASHVFVFNS